MFLVPALVAAVLCRYTVRDLGFVDLAGATYSLARVGAGPGELDVQLPADGVPADWLLRDTNLAFAALPVGATADPRVAAAGPEGGWVLHREGLAPLRLADVAVPAEVAVERAVRSELRDALAARTVDSFAVLVVVEGEGGGRAAAELAAAREGLDLLSDQLPRPIVRPLAELRVTRERRADERVLRWAMGLDAEETRTAVALVYGRGRLAGTVLVGDAIERGELLAQLALVGESCECDTERDWLGEPSLPLVWDVDRRTRATADLGFDPESPLVRAEVARILERGRPVGPNARRRGVDDVVFGYDEAALEPALEIGAPRAEPPPAATESRPVRVFEARGDDDWSFEDPAVGSVPAPTPPRATRRFDPLLLAGGVVLGLVALGAAAVLLTRGAR